MDDHQAGGECVSASCMALRSGQGHFRCVAVKASRGLKRPCSAGFIYSAARRMRKA